MLFLIALASATTYLDYGFLVSAPSSGPFAGGVSAPTVEWDATAEQYVMFFESPFTEEETPTFCGSAWRIGRATSSDGVFWDIDDTPVLEPDVGDESSPRACAVNQPAIVFDGETWHLLFSQAGADPGDGSSAFTGISYATSADGIAFTLVDDAVIPAVAPEMGLASATLVDDTLYVAYSRSPDIWSATLDVGTHTWTVAEAPTLTALDVGERAATWVLGPSLNCTDGEGLEVQMVFGADDVDGTRVLGTASTADFATWTVDPDSLEFVTLHPGDFAHWDSLVTGEDTSTVWYAADDPFTGVTGIGVAASGVDRQHPVGRACITTGGGDTGGGDTGEDDTGTTDTGGDTGATDTGGDTGTPADTDTGVADTAADPGDSQGGKADDPGGGCDCDTTQMPLVGFVGGPLAALLIRRRRG